MKYTILPCSESDTDFLWEKESEAYQSRVPEAEGASAEEKHIFKVTGPLSRIIGGCVMGIDLSKTAELERLWVDGPFRGQGMGSALVRAAERAARERGCPRIMNSYCFDFQGARPLFEKLGYRLNGVIRNWPRGFECYSLVKKLGSPAEEDGISTVPGQGRFEILPGTEQDGAFIAGMLETANSAFAPRSHPYLDLDRKLVDGAGRMVAGCIAGVSGWDTLHIDALWMGGNSLNQAAGAFLLSDLEREAKRHGAYLARAAAADDQASFFRDRGYSVSIAYEDGPKWYVMLKPL